MNLIEGMVLILAYIILAIYYYKGGYGKKIFVWSILAIPILYFSINMVTEIVTSDEIRYFNAFIDIRNVDETKMLMKTLYEYRFTQLTLGSIFSILPDTLKSSIGREGLWHIYKIGHWFMFYGVILFIAYIWRKYILNGTDILKKQIVENMILLGLLGLPLGCLLLKVVNYDSSSVYMSLLGFSLVWAAEKTNKMYLGYLGTIAIGMACLDKWTSLPYWCIGVTLFSYLVIKNSDTIRKKFIYGIGSIFLCYLTAIILSLLCLSCMTLQRGNLHVKLNVGIITFSFTHAIRAAINGDMSVDYVNPDKYILDSFPYIFSIILLMIFCVCIILLITINNTCKKIIEKSLIVITSSISMIGIVIGIIGTYFIPMYIAPYRKIAENYYQSTDIFDGWIYHYGAKNMITHFIYKMCYMCATIICNVPTCILILLFINTLLMILNWKKASELFFCELLYIISIFLLVIYLVMGLPVDARYYGVPIYMLIMVNIYLFYEYVFINQIVAKVGIFAVLLYFVEMVCYIPNVKSFSPIWVVRNRDYNETVRMGTWYAGEAMLWGEGTALGGKKVKSIVDENTPSYDYTDITIYDNYLTEWIDNPGFNYKGYPDKEIQYDDKTYIVLSKFSLFRDEIPTFLEEIEPLDVVSYKGEITLWIYRGDQLLDYIEDFE